MDSGLAGNGLPPLARRTTEASGACLFWVIVCFLPGTSVLKGPPFAETAPSRRSRDTCWKVRAHSQPKSVRPSQVLIPEKVCLLEREWLGLPELGTKRISNCEAAACHAEQSEAVFLE